MKSHRELIELARLATANAAAETMVDNNIKNAKSSLEAYWAGSATAMYIARCKAGAVRTVRAK